MGEKSRGKGVGCGTERPRGPTDLVAEAPA